MDSSRLAAFPLFAHLPAAELEEVATAMREVEVDEGSRVTTADDLEAGLYCVEEGVAEVVNESGEAAHALGPGDTFGEIALLLTGERTATVVARTPLRLLTLSDQDFQQIRERVPELEGALRRLGVQRAGR